MGNIFDFINQEVNQFFNNQLFNNQLLNWNVSELKKYLINSDLILVHSS